MPILSGESEHDHDPVKVPRPIRNFAAAAAIAAVSGTLCWSFLHRLQLGAADFGWAHDATRTLLSGGDPYANTAAGTIPYPLPAVLLALPFAPLPAEVAGGVFFGMSSGLLALGLIRQHPERLLIFLAYPYWAALMTAQWTPLIMCTAFFPLALTFCTAKPQIGAPVALTHLSRTGLMASAVLLLASFVIRPRWPMEWIPLLHAYQHFVPFLVVPGPLLALALWRWRDRDARLLFPALHSAATLVLRFVPPVADSENAPQHSGHRRLQLDGWPLALVSHADLYAPGGILGRSWFFPSHAGDRAPAIARRKISRR